MCVEASPDLGGTFDVGGARALPGECVRSVDAGALVSVTVAQDGGVKRRRRVRASSTAVTEVVLVDGRKFKRQYARCPSAPGEEPSLR